MHQLVTTKLIPSHRRPLHRAQTRLITIPKSDWSVHLELCQKKCVRSATASNNKPLHPLPPPQQSHFHCHSVYSPIKTGPNPKEVKRKAYHCEISILLKRNDSTEPASAMFTATRALRQAAAAAHQAERTPLIKFVGKRHSIPSKSRPLLLPFPLHQPIQQTVRAVS